MPCAPIAMTLLGNLIKRDGISKKEK